MVWDHGELVQHEGVGGVLGWELGDEELWGGILKGIELFLVAWFGLQV